MSVPLRTGRRRAHRIEGPLDRRFSDFQGITCAYCHRMYDASAPPPGDFADPAAPYAGNARIYLSIEEDTMRGPFSDAMPEWHLVADSALHRSSALCGQCHDVTNPALNRRDPATGGGAGDLPFLTEVV